MAFRRGRLAGFLALLSFALACGGTVGPGSGTGGELLAGSGPVGSGAGAGGVSAGQVAGSGAAGAATAGASSSSGAAGTNAAAPGKLRDFLGDPSFPDS